MFGHDTAMVSGQIHSNKKYPGLLRGLSLRRKIYLIVILLEGESYTTRIIDTAQQSDFSLFLQLLDFLLDVRVAVIFPVMFILLIEALFFCL